MHEVTHDFQNDPPWWYLPLIFLYPSNFEVGGGMQESYFYFSVHGISSLMDLIHFKQ